MVWKKKGNKSMVRMLESVLIMMAVTCFIFPASAVRADVGAPGIINYQGRLLDANGNLLGGAGADYCFKFSIYDEVVVGPPDNKLWPAGVPSSMTINVKDGVFDVGIGDQLAGGDALDFNFQDNDTVFINVEVAQKNGATCAPGDGVEVFETLSPRQRIYSAPYSINSNSVDGFHASQQASGNEIPALASGNLVLGGVNPQINAVSSTNLYMQGSVDSGNILTNILSGFMGVGTMNPMAKLHIKGNGGILNLEGGDNAFMQFYPGGFGAGRKGYFGFAGVSSTVLTIANENAGGNIIIASNNGNVGIGTDAPQEKLHLAGGSFLQEGPIIPKVVGGSGLVFPGGGAKQIFVAGNYAYIVLNNSAGTEILRVVDITNPALPEIVGGSGLSLPGFPSSVFVAGRYVYMVFDNAAGTNSFRAVDISNPAVPKVVGGSSLVLPANGQHIFVSGRYAYITFDNAAGTDNFRVVDVSNPAGPVVVGGASLNLPVAARQVYVEGRYAYLTFYNTVNTDAFRIIDISNPSAPIVVGGAGFVLGYSAWGVHVSGRYAYITFDNAAGTDNFRVVDVSNPTAPTVAGGSALSLPGFSRSIFVFGHYACVVFSQGAGSDVLRVIDITGIEAVSGLIHSLSAGSLQVEADAIINNHLSLGGGMHIDGGGLFVYGGSGVVGDSSFIPLADSMSSFVVKNATGDENLLTADTVNNFVKIGDDGGVADPTTLLVLDKKMDAGDPAGIAGATYYNSNIGKFRCYENGIWRDCDVGYEIVSLFADAVGVAMTNPPAGGAEPPNNITRTKINLSDFRSFRGVFIASTASGLVKLRLQYSTDNATWYNFGNDIAATAPVNAVSAGNFELVPIPAKTDAYVRALIVGNGSLDAVIRKIELQLLTN